MGSHDFFFSLEVSSQGVPAALIEDLAMNVFRHCGCSSDSAEGLRDALTRATDTDTSAGVRRCDVQFRARNNELEVLVSSNGGRIWQSTIFLS